MDYELIKRDYGYKVEFIVHNMRLKSKKDLVFDNERDAQIALRMLMSYDNGYRDEKITEFK